MSEAYKYKIQDLQHEIETGGARPAVIDTAVNELFADRDKRLAGDLLSLLSDKAQHDEGMFSLIHAAENIDKNAYIPTLLSVFPHLLSSAPRWASIVLMRVLNNGFARAEMVRYLRDASPPVKQAVRDLCGRINEVNPQFLSKTVPVILAASE